MEYVIYLVLAVGIFYAGWFGCKFFRDYRVRAMVVITTKDLENLDDAERLRKALDTWICLRNLFYKWRGSLTGAEYVSAVSLMSQLERYMDYQ